MIKLLQVLAKYLIYIVNQAIAHHYTYYYLMNCYFKIYLLQQKLFIYSLMLISFDYFTF